MSQLCGEEFHVSLRAVAAYVDLSQAARHVGARSCLRATSLAEKAIATVADAEPIDGEIQRDRQVFALGLDNVDWRQRSSRVLVRASKV
ncbi:hypothetical protein PtA15_5A430 [Puccinia triticina]|uniref:Uncharacterized protein n=1 Tax=Puccinia triticina TaxID=208348 RepID=A0ABY7CLI5_9BASI|nr:uncharacterized protein PtA15_5A430 [Puccinia triticina]WAQ84857.1 hypothetical protein PtA15_5A430 [Puccinia triticina]